MKPKWESSLSALEGGKHSNKRVHSSTSDLKSFHLELFLGFCKDSIKDLTYISFLSEWYDYKKHIVAEFRLCSELPL